MAAPSKGSYLNSVIKPNYTATKQPPAVPDQEHADHIVRIPGATWATLEEFGRLLGVADTQVVLASVIHLGIEQARAAVRAEVGENLGTGC